VQNFRVANALYGCHRFHIDGLRVDAVASMLYLDYSRKEGQWIPNQFGGRENLEAIDFLRKFNHITHTEFPGVMTIAEESTAWPQVTRPPYLGGLGFSFKSNMDWMHDTLIYSRRPVHRKFHQNDLLSRCSTIITKTSSSRSPRRSRPRQGLARACLRLASLLVSALLGYQWLFPGKMFFMGCEFGQSSEWNANGQLDWWLLTAGPYHKGAQRFVQDLNQLYLAEPSLWKHDFDPHGFYWIDASDREASVLSFVRQDPEGNDPVAIILNLPPVARLPYRIGLPKPGKWREVVNSDAAVYGGSNVGNMGGVIATQHKCHGKPYSAEFTLPPLSIIAFRPENPRRPSPNPLHLQNTRQCYSKTGGLLSQAARTKPKE
jgi:1,4-alpha-glucan branching enzyme